jgi:hypothetical protein
MLFPHISYKRIQGKWPGTISLPELQFTDRHTLRHGPPIQKHWVTAHLFSLISGILLMPCYGSGGLRLVFTAEVRLHSWAISCKIRGEWNGGAYLSPSFFDFFLLLTTPPFLHTHLSLLLEVIVLRLYFITSSTVLEWPGIAQSVYWRVTCWMVEIRFQAGARNFSLLHAV